MIVGLAMLFMWAPLPNNQGTTTITSGARTYFMTSSLPPMLTPGRMLAGNFCIKRLLGQGGMSQVYLADDTNLRVNVVLKVPTLSLLVSDRGGERFLREARMAAQLRGGPHIVGIHGCHTDPGFTYSLGPALGELAIPFIVMDYLDDGNLADRLEGGPLLLPQAIDWFEKICRGIQYAHSIRFEHDGTERCGIVHRDIKPENICFSKRGDINVVDFGLARNFEDSVSLISIAGTPQYMAPEQWDATSRIDHRLDIYALGVLLFRMVTGTVPFAGSRVDEIMAGHLFRMPPNPRTLRPELTPGMARAILRALEKEPGARFASVDEFARAVRLSVDANGRPREVIRHDAPGMPLKTDRDAAQRHLLAGDALAREGEYDRAIQEYDLSVEAHALDANAFINRGFCYYKKKLYARAAAEYSHALDISPSHAEAWNNRGMIWLELGQYSEAIHDFEHAIERDPDHPLAPNNLRNARRRMASGMD